MEQFSQSLLCILWLLKATERKATNTSMLLESIQQMLQQREEAEERLREDMRRQHEEKMELLKSFIDIFKKK